MAQPSGIALDSAGHLFVADVYNRVLVYAPPFSNGIGAARLMGVTRTPAGQAPSGPTNVTVGSYANNRFNPPEGRFRSRQHSIYYRTLPTTASCNSIRSTGGPRRLQIGFRRRRCWSTDRAILF